MPRRRRRHLDEQLKQQPRRNSTGRDPATAPKAPATGLAAKGLPASAALLGGEQLQRSQQQALVEQIGQVQGNRRLQGMMVALQRDPGAAPADLSGFGLPGFTLQRQDEGNPVAPPDPGTTIHPTVRYGSRGPAVEELQQKLNQYGTTPPLVVDGIFGPLTRAAVVAFQQENGLAADGIVGPLTWGRIDELGLSSTVGRVEKTWSEEVGGQTYGMTSRYTWRINPTEIRVTVNLRFTGVNDAATVGSLLSAITNVWNRYQAVNEETGETLDVVFEPQSVTSGADNEVRLLPGSERSDAANWYLDDPDIDNTAAHEFGHMIGLEDEYQRSHRDYTRLVGEEPEPGELDNVDDPEEVADAMWDALHNNSPAAARVGPANQVIADYGLHQGIYAELVGQVYQTKYGVDIMDDIVAQIPDDDEWDIVDPFTYSSGSIMGVMTNHDHPVEPRHLREFVGYIEAAKGGTWRAQESA
jgi:peptidoglycan hydrolase-like protein with peptidoglycan-binding domain